MKEEKIAEILKALAHPTRLKILELLKEGERCVCEMLLPLKLNQANVSQHLAILKHFGVVEAKKKGFYVYYRLRNPKFAEILKALDEILIELLNEEQETLRELRRAK